MGMRPDIDAGCCHLSEFIPVHEPLRGTVDGSIATRFDQKPFDCRFALFAGQELESPRQLDDHVFPR
jgi:hypothetical protein